MASGPSLQLDNGHMIPQLGFGTFDAPKGVVAKAVKEAFDAGYRHLDCAAAYENEEEVNQGIAESMKKHGLKREDIFITSKLWCDKHDPKDVRKACEEEGAELHSADPNRFVPEYHKLEDTWCAMEELVPAGLVKSIGVSNYNKRQLERIIKYGKIVPAVNQIEVNLHWSNTKLIEYCHSKNIVIEGYSPFGSPGYHKNQVKPILQLDPVIEIAKIHNVTPAQVLVRHSLQRKIVVLAKSVTPERIRKNFDVLGFELSEEEVNKLNKAGLNIRIATGLSCLSDHPEYPYHDEF